VTPSVQTLVVSLVQGWPTAMQEPLWQLPVPVLQLCPCIVQLMQLSPPMPQEVSVWVVTQAPPFTGQQPLQLLVLQPVAVQTPLTHESPPGQATQVEPLAPHWAFVAGVTHVPPLQQPLGQEVPSHGGGTHAPLVQTFPPVQAMQVAPLSPHAVLVGGDTQLPLLQQPVGQDAAVQVGAVQTPLVQTLTPVQAAQVPPAVPHWLLVGGETQVLPAQQPLGQLVPSQGGG
jgi:hypothetical protein